MKKLKSTTITNGNGITTIRQLLDVAIKAVSSEAALKKKVQFLTNDRMLLKNDSKPIEIDLSRFKNVFVIGSGKASVGMAVNLVHLLPCPIRGGIILTKFQHFNEESKANLQKHGIVIREGSHPVPCKKGAEATLEILNLIQKEDSVDTVFFYCLSGGSSALTGGLSNKLSLPAIQSIYEFLLKSGIPIEEMNTIRKLLSSFQGGKVVHNRRSTFVTFLVSDVVGDSLSIIGGAPTYNFDTKPTLPIARDIILEKLKNQNGFPVELNEVFFNPNKMVDENPVPGIHDDDTKNNNFHLIISSNKDALTAMETYCKENFHYDHVECLTSCLIGEVQQVAKVLAAIVRERIQKSPNKSFALFAGGECTVTIPSDCKGEGGRNLEMVLALKHEFKTFEENLKEVINKLAFTSFATDGGDGKTDYAGAIVGCGGISAGSLKEMRRSLAQHDSLNFFLELKKNDEFVVLIDKMNTNTNVMDIIVILYHV